jgi:hypothetical protein
MVRKELEFQTLKTKHHEECDCIYQNYERIQIEDSVSLDINPELILCNAVRREVDYDLLNCIDNDDLLFYLNYQTNMVREEFLIDMYKCYGMKKFTEIMPHMLKDKYALMMIREQAYVK